jgi:hypothetical protein
VGVSLERPLRYNRYEGSGEIGLVVFVSLLMVSVESEIAVDVMMLDVVLGMALSAAMAVVTRTVKCMGIDFSFNFELNLFLGSRLFLGLCLFWSLRLS